MHADKKLFKDFAAAGENGNAWMDVPHRFRECPVAIFQPIPFVDFP